MLKGYAEIFGGLFILSSCLLASYIWVSHLHDLGEFERFVAFAPLAAFILIGSSAVKDGLALITGSARRSQK